MMMSEKKIRWNEMNFHLKKKIHLKNENFRNSKSPNYKMMTSLWSKKKMMMTMMKETNKKTCCCYLHNNYSCLKKMANRNDLLNYYSCPKNIPNFCGEEHMILCFVKKRMMMKLCRYTDFYRFAVRYMMEYMVQMIVNYLLSHFFHGLYLHCYFEECMPGVYTVDGMKNLCFEMSLLLFVMK